MLIETDGFMVWVDTSTTYGWKQVNMVAEVQHKQGYQKHFKRRVETRRAKRRNRRLHIDLTGRGEWWFFQGYYKSWDETKTDLEEAKKGWIERRESDPEWFDDRYGKNFLAVKLEKIDRELKKEYAEYHDPYPDEEQCREPYRRYRDDPSPCDRSGRHDSRPWFKKVIAEKEIRSYLVGTTNKFDEELEEEIRLEKQYEDLYLTEQFLFYDDDEDLWDNPFKRHMSPEDYQELVDENEYSCGYCGQDTYNCSCFEPCLFCGLTQRNCRCDVVKCSHCGSTLCEGECLDLKFPCPKCGNTNFARCGCPLEDACQ